MRRLGLTRALAVQREVGPAQRTVLAPARMCWQSTSTGAATMGVARFAPLHEAAMRGNLDVTRLLLEHGADPNVRDVGYKATPAGWAEHFGQTEAERFLAALGD